MSEKVYKVYDISQTYVIIITDKAKYYIINNQGRFECWREKFGFWDILFGSISQRWFEHKQFGVPNDKNELHKEIENIMWMMVDQIHRTETISNIFKSDIDLLDNLKKTKENCDPNCEFAEFRKKDNRAPCCRTWKEK